MNTSNNNNTQQKKKQPIKPIKRVFSHKRSKKQSLNIKNSNQNDTKLFVGGIPADTKKDELESIFSQFGEVLDVYIPINKKKKCLKGFAFVAMADKPSYKEVLKVKEFKLRGKTMTARAALRENDACQISKVLQKQKLFVKGFPFSTKEAEISAFFEKFGKVNRVLMCKDKLQKFRGFAYVIMNTQKGFQSVLEECTSGSSASYRGYLLFKGGNKIYVSNSKTQKEVNETRKVQKEALQLFVQNDSNTNQGKVIKKASSGKQKSLNQSQKNRIEKANRRGSMKVAPLFLWSDEDNQEASLVVTKIPDFFTQPSTVNSTKDIGNTSDSGSELKEQENLVRQHGLLFKPCQGRRVHPYRQVNIDSLGLKAPTTLGSRLRTFGLVRKQNLKSSLGNNYCLRVKRSF